MATKKTIAIIGASGNMGTAIAKSLAKGNYRLLLMSGEAGASGDLASTIKHRYNGAEVETIPCSVDASWEADIIIMAVPYSAEKAVAEKIRAVATGKIVISIANPMNMEFTALATGPGTSAAEELQQLLPYSKVVKAFNTTYAADFEQPIIDGKTVDAFIAGNDEDSLETVQELVATAGFNPVVAGNLQTSRTLEGMQALLIQLTQKNNYNWLAGWKILHN
jgi:NADPH-dependent F420 reductase